MAIVEVRRNDNRQLQNIANTLAAAKKIVVITGAGISTNCGIPDFRSEEGLYALIRKQYDTTRTDAAFGDSPRNVHTQIRSLRPIITPSQPLLPTNVKGKDLFDSQLWADPTSTSVFYRFISSLRETIRLDVKRTTPTHRFIRTLRDRRKLVRCYTQNIDGLEGREGLSTGLTLGKGNRQRFTKKAMARPPVSFQKRPEGDLDGGCEVVQLHGDLDSLRCTLCQQTCEWEDQGKQLKAMLLAGTAPLCESCIAKDQERQNRGKRGTKIGTLRPNVVLYGEEHPAADALGGITTHDLGLSPDVLLVLGTSLHVHGLKTLVREFAKSVHARPGGKGKVIFVNLSRPSESMWKDVFDYWVPMDCDAWVNATRVHRPDLFQVQEDLKMPVRKMIEKQHVIKSTPLTESTENKENVVANPCNSQSQGKSRTPQVTVPITPKKRKPLQAHEAKAAPPRLTKAASERPLIRDSLEPPTSSLQLPTPPSSNFIDSTCSPTKKRRRTLAEAYNELAQTASKCRKAAVSIWSDADTETYRMDEERTGWKRTV